MVRSAAFFLVALACCLVSSSCQSGQPSNLHVASGIDAALQRVHAIDNHAHPVALPVDGQPDRNFDALPADAIEDIAFPEPLRPGSPAFPAAWQTLFGYRVGNGKPDATRLAQAKEDKRRDKGDLYPAWVLNQTLTDIMLANRVAMGRGLSPDRFKWVPFVDMFLFPLNNAALKARDSEHRAFLTQEEKLLASYLSTAQIHRLPPSLDDYLTFLSHTLESWKSQGAVALKFEMAYLRDLQISNPPREAAERVYAIYAQSSEPSPDEYKVVQDYIFRYISQEAGRVGLPIHIHSSIGAGSYFRDSNAHSFELESVFNDPALRRTKFVLLHASWPFTSEAAALILKPNVYVDLSGLPYFTYPVKEAQAIRVLLESAPEKVLYGSDASPLSDTVGWEETNWIAARNTRQALGIALTGMLQDGEVTEERAEKIGQLVMRENARSIYGF